MPKHEISKPYFPGFTRKSVTFTIDDGKLDTDEKFISIVAPYGIKGTFNLCTDHLGEEERERVLKLYRGFELSNHCAWHPCCFPEERRADIVDAPFDAQTADETKIYPDFEHAEGLYWVRRSRGWRRGAFLEDYLRFAAEAREKLEAVFGKSRVKGFAWPFGRQDVPGAHERLIEMNFSHIRRGGNVLDSTGYAVPEDLMDWSYTADNTVLKAQVPIYENYPDDGELKFFAAGVHSIDYERDDNFCDLEYFARTFGNKPEQYYTAGVDEIFHYSVCAKQLVITDDTIENPTDTDIYIKIDGEKIVLRAGTTLDLDTKQIII